MADIGEGSKLRRLWPKKARLWPIERSNSSSEQTIGVFNMLADPVTVVATRHDSDDENERRNRMNVFYAQVEIAQAKQFFLDREHRDVYIFPSFNRASLSPREEEVKWFVDKAIAGQDPDERWIGVLRRASDTYLCHIGSLNPKVKLDGRAFFLVLKGTVLEQVRTRRGGSNFVDYEVNRQTDMLTFGGSWALTRRMPQVCARKLAKDRWSSEFGEQYGISSVQNASVVISSSIALE